MLSSCSVLLGTPSRGVLAFARGQKQRGAQRTPRGRPGGGVGGAMCTPKGRGRRPRAVARSQTCEDHTTTPRWRARARIVLSRRGRLVSRIGQKKEKSTTCDAERAPEERLVAPNPWATLGTHVVASPGSHGAREGVGLSVHSFGAENVAQRRAQGSRKALARLSQGSRRARARASRSPARALREPCASLAGALREPCGRKARAGRALRAQGSSLARALREI